MSGPEKMIPYGCQYFGEEEIRAVTEVLKSNFISQGPKIAEFEEKFASKVDAPYAVAVSSGTAALHIAALAIGLEPGDEVITTPLSFIATANAILYAGAKPVFADIDPETLCLDPDQVKKKITRRTKAVFPVHFAGHPAALNELSALCEKQGLVMVEDAAHALGARLGNETIGACRHSVAATFSFHPVKHITTGEGGIVTTRDKKIYEKLRLYRNHGMTREADKCLEPPHGGWYFEMQTLGFNYRITDLQAAIGIVQLERLDSFIARRREIVSRYQASFTSLPAVRLPRERKGVFHSYHLYILELDLPKLKRSRKEIFDEFRKRNLGVQVHYMPISSQPYYKKLGYQSSDYPFTEAYYASAVSLPLHPKMTDGDVEYVIRQTSDILKTSLK